MVRAPRSRPAPLGTTAGADGARTPRSPSRWCMAGALLAAARLAARAAVPAAAPIASHSVGWAAAVAGGSPPTPPCRSPPSVGARWPRRARANPPGSAPCSVGNPDEVLATLRAGPRPGQPQRRGADRRRRIARRPGPAEAPPPARASVMRLPVAGTFHTRFIAPAEDARRRRPVPRRPGAPVAVEHPRSRSSPTAPMALRPARGGGHRGALDRLYGTFPTLGVTG